MNYKESRQYIDYAQKYGSVLGLDNMEEMLTRLGNPQDDLKFVHVAGTNGKGSVLAYVSTILRETGYRVGRYVSPAIYSYRERMDVNGNPIGREAFAQHLSAVARVIEQMVKDGLPHPTPFEIETAVAFLFFKAEKCDLVALETGMGGMLDATNIIRTTKVAILTSISMDHMGFLGNTLTDIARNKAGIIKPGCRVVSALQKPDAMKVVESTCRRFKVPLTVADRQEISVVRGDYLGQSFVYQEKEYEISLPGVYQIENVAVALKTIEVLQDMGYEISEQAVKDGLKKTVWGGRFSTLRQEPVFIIDGAHNPDAALNLKESIQEYFSGKTIYYIMGMFRDKECEKVAKITSGFASEIWTIATPDNDRALPAEELAKLVRRYNKNVTPMKSIYAAVDAAMKKAKKEDVIIAFGSLSFLGEITRIVQEYER